MAGIISVIMLVMLMPVCNVANAAESGIVDWVLNNNYVNDSIETNWYGQMMDLCPGYKEGDTFAAYFGGDGWFRDADDGSLAVFASTSAVSGNECYLARRVIAEPVADDSELVFTFKFKTGSKPMASATEIWFRISSQENGEASETDANLFMLKNSMTGGMSHAFASSTTWPFTEKIPDRDPNGVSFEYDKDYELEITLKPKKENASRFVAKIREDGSEKGTVIVNEWTGFKKSQFKQLTQMTMVTTSRSDAIEEEPLIYLKGISVKAIIPNKPLGVTYFPENGNISAHLDTDCYAEFDAAVEPVSASSVSVSGGAVVDGVTMENGNKRVAVALSGLEPKKAYTVTLNDVKGVVADEAFDYTWTFTTDSGVNFSAPYYGLTKKEVEVKDITADEFAPVDTTNKAYADGAWGSANLDGDGKIVSGADLTKISDEFKAEDGYVWAYTHNQGAATEDRAVAKHFESMSDGDILELSTTLKFNYFFDSGIKSRNYSVASGVELTGTNGNLTLLQFLLSDNPADDNNHYTIMRFLNNTDAKSYDSTEGCADVTTTGTTQAGWMENVYPYNVNSNGVIHEKGTNGTDYSQLYANSSTHPSANDGDVKLVLKAEPDTENSTKYKVTLTATGQRMNLTSERLVDKNIILGLSDVCLVSSRSANANTAASNKLIGMKDLDLTVTSGGDNPKTGNTKIYVDYDNVSGVAADVDILVVEKNPTSGKIVSIHVTELEDISGSGIATVPVTLEEAGSKLEVYVLSSADGMILLSEPGFSNVVER